jgi:hypothetical protein
MTQTPESPSAGTAKLPLPSIDRRAFIGGLGGAAVVATMSPEARADALEAHLNEAMDAQKKYPSVAEVNAKINTRTYRRGVGKIFAGQDGNVGYLNPMPEAPTLIDFIKLRLTEPLNHCLQSANLARKNGLEDELVLACLLHDLPLTLMRTQHGFWGAQLFEPYISERATFAIRHHAALRFFPDEESGYEYPDLYREMFGEDYVPPPHVQAEYEWVRKHRWYSAPRHLTNNDLYAFDPNVTVDLEDFEDLIGREFRQPREGLGFDGSPVAHMWRTLADPDSPL